MQGKLVGIVGLAPIFLGLAACSGDETMTGVAGAAVAWNVETQADTTAESPFVFLEITVTTQPADTAFIHLTVESLNFERIDFAQVRLPDEPGHGTDSFKILGRLPIWTDWLMVIDVWTQHLEATSDTVFWDVIIPTDETAPGEEIGFSGPLTWN